MKSLYLCSLSLLRQSNGHLFVRFLGIGRFVVVWESLSKIAKARLSSTNDVHHISPALFNKNMPYLCMQSATIKALFLVCLRRANRFDLYHQMMHQLVHRHPYQSSVDSFNVSFSPLWRINQGCYYFKNVF